MRISRCACAIAGADARHPARTRTAAPILVIASSKRKAAGASRQYSALRTNPDKSHAAPVLPAYLEERVSDLPARADAHRVHQHREHVFVADHGLLEPLQHLSAFGGIPALKVAQ